MDPKSKANFINSVADGQKIPCPHCNTYNDADSCFCMTCGIALAKSAAESGETPVQTGQTSSSTSFAAISETESEREPIKPEDHSTAASAEANDEPDSAFAKGLPSWDILPPQVVVRRQNKK